MCSNEELRLSNVRLELAVKENTAVQQDTSNTIASMLAEWKTWRETRCEDHHKRLHDGEIERSEIRGEMKTAIGKAAGVVATITILIAVSGVAISIAVAKAGP